MTDLDQWIDSQELPIEVVEVRGREFKFQALSRRRYRELIDAHPPKDKTGEWNPDTFPPALIAACSVEPKLTTEQAERIWSGDNWSAADSNRLFLVAWNLCEYGRGAVFTLPGFAGIGDSGQSSTTASPKASPTRSSSVGTKRTRTKRSAG